MQFSINNATLLGNITKDPQVRYTQSGQAVCSFSLATNRSVKYDQGYKDEATFHNIVCWAKLAELVARDYTKGDKVYIQGRIQNRSYEKDGVTKYISEIVADAVIGFKKKGTQGNDNVDDIDLDQVFDDMEKEKKGGAKQAEEEIDLSDIPF